MTAQETELEEGELVDGAAGPMATADGGEAAAPGAAGAIEHADTSRGKMAAGEGVRRLSTKAAMKAATKNIPAEVRITSQATACIHVQITKVSSSTGSPPYPPTPQKVWHAHVSGTSTLLMCTFLTCVHG